MFKMNIRTELLFLLIFSTLFYQNKVFSQESSSINVVHLYTPKSDEKPIHDFIFPIVTEYLKKMGTDYNKTIRSEGKRKKQINKIFVSTIFRSRMEQRNQLFDYILTGKGFKNFFSLYDQKNEQFAVEFVKIISPIFNNKDASTRLFQSINSELDRVFKSPLKLISNIPTSDYLVNYFYLTKGTSFVSSRESIEEIGENIITSFEIDPSFIEKAQEELSAMIKSKLKLSDGDSQKGAIQIINMITAKSFFQYIQPILKKKGRDILKDPLIGGALAIWLKKAPAYSKHSIPDLTDEELEKLKEITNKGTSYTFAIDLGMKTNKGLDSSAIWNYQSRGNTISALRQVILDEKNIIFQTKSYQLEVLQEKLLTGKEENAIHIEFKITLLDQATKTQQTKIADIDSDDDDDPLTKKINQAVNNIDVDLSRLSNSKNKTFEDPNDDSKEDADKSAPNFTEKDFNRLDGKNKKITDKTFEDPNDKQVEYKKENQKKDGKALDLKSIYD